MNIINRLIVRYFGYGTADNVVGMTKYLLLSEGPSFTGWRTRRLSDKLIIDYHAPEVDCLDAMLIIKVDDSPVYCGRNGTTKIYRFGPWVNELHQAYLDSLMPEHENCRCVSFPIHEARIGYNPPPPDAPLPRQVSPPPPPIDWIITPEIWIGNYPRKR